MGNVRLYGSTSGYTELAPPAVAPDGVLTLPSGVGTLLTAEGGKVLQVVRATDGINQATSSASFVDAGISVTITPQRSTSSLLLVWATNISVYVSSGLGIESRYVITDSSNNIVGGETRLRLESGSGFNQIDTFLSLIKWATPATTLPVTYKGRFRLNSGTMTYLYNETFGAGQLYAIEVSA